MATLWRETWESGVISSNWTPSATPGGLPVGYKIVTPGRYSGYAAQLANYGAAVTLERTFSVAAAPRCRLDLLTPPTGFSATDMLQFSYGGGSATLKLNPVAGDPTKFTIEVICKGVVGGRLVTFSDTLAVGGSLALGVWHRIEYWDVGSSQYQLIIDGVASATFSSGLSGAGGAIDLVEDSSTTNCAMAFDNIEVADSGGFSPVTWSQSLAVSAHAASAVGEAYRPNALHITPLALTAQAAAQASVAIGRRLSAQARSRVALSGIAHLSHQITASAHGVVAIGKGRVVRKGPLATTVHGTVGIVRGRGHLRRLGVGVTASPAVHRHVVLHRPVAVHATVGVRATVVRTVTHTDLVAFTDGPVVSATAEPVHITLGLPTADLTLGFATTSQ